MIILTDTREKRPWQFDWYREVQAIEVTKVDTGDYTLKGYEHIVAIERKASTGELAVNLGKKKKAFLNEMTRMKEIPNRYIICEFPKEYLETFPYNSKIPGKDWKYLRVNKNYMLHMMKVFQDDFGITVLYYDNPQQAQDKAMEIFNEIVNGKKEDTSK